MTLNLSKEAVEERGGWKYRTAFWLFDHADEQDTLVLALVFRAAVLRNNPTDRIPRVGNNCIITEDKMVAFRMMQKNGNIVGVWFKVAKWNEIWNGVADRVKLTSEERVELFKDLRGFVTKDYSQKAAPV